MARDVPSDEAKSNADAIKNRQSDVEIVMRYSRWFLRSLGVWPMISEEQTNFQKRSSKFVTIIYLMAMAFPLIPTVLDTIIREKNSRNRLWRLAPVTSCLSSILKYVFMVRRCKTIKLCIDHMTRDWMEIDRPAEREIMTRNAKFGRGLTILGCAFMYTSGIFYHTMMPYFKGTRINEFNETVRPLVYPGFDIFLNPQKSPTYEIVFSTTFAAALIRYTVNIAACNLAAVFVTHACGQLQIAVARLENLFDDIDAKQSAMQLRKRISSIVHCHVGGLRFSTRIEDVMREICLIEVVAATLIICLDEYYCLTEWNNTETIAIVTYVIFLISYIFNIFIFCYIGELLREQCFDVGTSTYLIDWYRLPGKTGLALVMILAMSNYPRKITAGGMIDLSVASFGMIMKTSWMYLSVLRQMSY